MKKQMPTALLFAIQMFMLIGIIALIFLWKDLESDWRYDKDWMIGKSSEQIQFRYGKFDKADGEAGSDGLYRDCKCTYVLVTGHREFYTGDAEPDEYLSIYFDEYGIAYEVYKWIQPGG